jgi:phosphonate transport system ATP-binding protein
MLELASVRKRFGSREAVRGVSLTAEEGQMVALIGPSGAGKSTLLRMINRLERPDSGTVRWKGEGVTALEGAALRRWRARCAMVFQQFHLVGRMDALTNVLMGCLGRRSPLAAMVKYFGRAERMSALALMEELGILHLAGQAAERLSGGEQQRVAVARALFQQPELLLADEPASSLDPENARLLMELLRDTCRARGLTVVASLHSVDLARRFCSRVIGMTQGAVTYDGPAAHLTGEEVLRVYPASTPRRTEASLTIQPPPRGFHEPGTLRPAGGEQGIG